MKKRVFIILLILTLFLLFISGCQYFNKTGAAIGPDTLCTGVSCENHCGNGEDSSVRYYSGTCKAGSCSYLSADCNALDHYLPDAYCKNGDAYKIFRNYYCSAGKCSFEELEFLQERCTKGCDAGVCIP